MIIDTDKLPYGLYAISPFPEHKDNPLISIDSDQSWFWTHDWLEGELKVNEELKNGDFETFDTMEDFLKGLVIKDEI